MKKKKTPKQKLKKVTVRFIQPESEIGLPIYALLHELMRAHHREIVSARVALAWQLAWQPDVDGRVVLGQCKKVADLEREVCEGRLLHARVDGGTHGYDFVILLRQAFWQDPNVSDLQRRALLDHELCHATVTLDAHGDPAVDDCGRIVYRTRKHDLEEFAEIAERHGCWKRDLEYFARAIDRARSKVKGRWIGYERLQQDLRALGLTVTLDAIVGWTDGQRRDAAIWIDLLQAGSTNPDHRLEVMIPAFLQAAAPPPGPAEAFPEIPVAAGTL